MNEQVERVYRIDENGTVIFMDREVGNRMGLDPNKEIVHINGCQLDCRRENLRSKRDDE